MNSFKAAYKHAKTGGDLDKILYKMDLSEKKKLRDALEVVDEYTGLDMRQEYLKTDLTCKIKRKE